MTRKPTLLGSLMILLKNDNRVDTTMISIGDGNDIMPEEENLR